MKPFALVAMILLLLGLSGCWAWKEAVEDYNEREARKNMHIYESTYIDATGHTRTVQTVCRFYAQSTDCTTY